MMMPDWFIAMCVHPVTLLAVGGGAGANARYWFGRLVAQIQGGVEFPWATFIINVSGSIILGFVAAAFMRHPDVTQRNWYLLLGAGFCGGFTTFSTFSFETVKLLQEGKTWQAAVYAVGSVLAAVLGMWLALRIAGNPD